MLRLTSLKIDRFRNVEPCTLEFGDTFNVLLGKNATGKTTLLKLVVAAINGDFEEFDEPLDMRWTLQFGESRIDAQLTRVSNDAEEGSEWTTELNFTLFTNSVEQGSFVCAHDVWRWRTVAGLERSTPAPPWQRAPNGLLAAAYALRLPYDHPDVHVAWFVQPTERFDEALQQFDAIFNSPWSAKLQVREGRARGFQSRHPPLLSPAMLARMIDTDADTLHLRPFSLSDFPVERIARLPKLLGRDKMELEPRLLQRTPSESGLHYEFEGLRGTAESDLGQIVSHNRWSFGQQRLFAFFWHLSAFEGTPVVADELLNGLHHEWIEACLDELYERQSFLATQHPLLLDHIPIENAEAARKTFIRCTSKRGEDGRTTLEWRNFTADEADRFHRAYATNIQQVSEILRTEGLW